MTQHADGNFLPIINADGDDVLRARLEPARHVVTMRRRQAKLRCANFVAIHPHAAFPNHPLQRQDDILIFPVRWNFDRALIPRRPDVAKALMQTLHRRTFEIDRNGKRLALASERRCAGKRNRIIQALLPNTGINAFIARIKLKLPRAIEAKVGGVKGNICQAQQREQIEEFFHGKV